VGTHLIAFHSRRIPDKNLRIKRLTRGRRTYNKLNIYFPLHASCFKWRNTGEDECYRRRQLNRNFVFHKAAIFFSMALPAHSGPRPLIQFRNHFSQTVGLLGRLTSPSQGRYINTGQHKHRINTCTHQTSMPRPCGYCDRQSRNKSVSKQLMITWRGRQNSLTFFCQGCTLFTSRITFYVFCPATTNNVLWRHKAANIFLKAAPRMVNTWFCNYNRNSCGDSVLTTVPSLWILLHFWMSLQTTQILYTHLLACIQLLGTSMFCLYPCVLHSLSKWISIVKLTSIGSRHMLCLYISVYRSKHCCLRAISAD
jgi:hypothetical protein